MILSLLRKDPHGESARALYSAAVDQARSPAFYTDFAVADSVEGRFEMVALHVWLVIRRLKSDGPQAAKLSQRLLEIFFEDLDSSLREMGVGDLQVARKIRGLAENFFGRMKAYEEAMGPDGAPGGLAAALARNVHESGDAADGDALAAYVRAADAALAAQPSGRIAGGIAAFANPGGAS